MNELFKSSNSPVGGGGGGVAHLWETAERPRKFPILSPSRCRKKEKGRTGLDRSSLPEVPDISIFFGDGKKWRFLFTFRGRRREHLSIDQTRGILFTLSACALAEFPRSKSWYNGRKRRNRQFPLEKELSVPVRRGLRQGKWKLWLRFMSEFRLFLYRSIALKILYLKSFD